MLFTSCVFTGVTLYANWCILFPQCLATPTSAISAIMLEAYKKYVLVALLRQGKVSKYSKDILFNSIVTSGAYSTQIHITCGREIHKGMLIYGVWPTRFLQLCFSLCVACTMKLPRPTQVLKWRGFRWQLTNMLSPCLGWVTIIPLWATQILIIWLPS